MKKTGKRMAFYLVGVLLLSLGTTGSAFFYKIHVDNARLQSVALPPAETLIPNGRLLVFAPHCDDETLGTGGLIARARDAGNEVRVVLMTNGDGYTFAAAKSLHQLRLHADDYIRFATKRQSETIRALKILGVPSNNVIFLGYPDRGLAPMWYRFWTPDNLYRSRYTGSICSPYRNSYRQNAPYCGKSVLADAKEIIAEFKPTDIYVPHPNDDHSDHWATNCFVTAALDALRLREDYARQIRVHTYLIHRGDWPVPQGLHPNSRLVPPNAMVNLDTKWTALSLDTATRDRKKQAILVYKSQTAVMRRYLVSFVRKNELFGDSRIRTATHVRPGILRVDGRCDDWQGIKPVIRDPVVDKLTRKLEGSGDIRSIYVAEDGTNLYLRADMRKRLSTRVHYRIRVHPITGKATEPGERNYELIIRRNHAPVGFPSGHSAWHESTIEISIPLKEFSSAQSLYIAMDTRISRILVDASAWRLIRIAPRQIKNGGTMKAGQT